VSYRSGPSLVRRGAQAPQPWFATRAEQVPAFPRSTVPHNDAVKLPAPSALLGQQAQRQSAPQLTAGVMHPARLLSGSRTRLAVATVVLASVTNAISCAGPSPAPASTPSATRSATPTGIPASTPTLAAFAGATDADVVPPEPVSQVNAVFPDSVKNVRISQPFFIYEIVVDQIGNVRDIHLLRASYTDEPYDTFDRGFRDAIAQWKYKPATRNGSPVAFRLTVTGRVEVR
jgi:TonB family protein